MKGREEEAKQRVNADHDEVAGRLCTFAVDGSGGQHVIQAYCDHGFATANH